MLTETTDYFEGVHLGILGLTLDHLKFNSSLNAQDIARLLDVSQATAAAALRVATHHRELVENMLRDDATRARTFMQAVLGIGIEQGEANA